MADETKAEVPASEGAETSEAPATQAKAAAKPAAPEAAVEEKAAEAATPATEEKTAEAAAPATDEKKADDAAPATDEKKADAAAPATDEKSSDEAAPAADDAPRRSRGRFIPAGVAHIRATFNNTIVSVADLRGGVISWSSAGRAGFKGSRKSTAFAATVVAQEAARGAVAKGMHEVEVRMQGAGAGRESAVRGLQSAGLNISVIKDVTPIPHNGCRPRKRRRV